MNHPLFQRGRGRDEAEFEELRKVLSRLKSCPPQTRSAVGAGVELANADFMRRFTGIESFRQSSAEEQERFWSDLGDLELGLRSQEVGLAMGVGLYRIWLVDTLAGQRNVVDLLGEELSELSRKR
jgi:hypothetical protein